MASRVESWLLLSTVVGDGQELPWKLARRDIIRCPSIPSIADGLGRRTTLAMMDDGCVIPAPSLSGTADTSSSRPAVVRELA